MINKTKFLTICLLVFAMFQLIQAKHGQSSAYAYKANVILLSQELDAPEAADVDGLPDY